MQIQLKVLNTKDPHKVEIVITKSELKKFSSVGLNRAAIEAIIRVGTLALTVGNVNVSLRIVDDPVECEAKVINEEEE